MKLCLTVRRKEEIDEKIKINHSSLPGIALHLNHIKINYILSYCPLYIAVALNPAVSFKPF